MPVYKIECVVHRTIRHYIPADSEEDAIEKLKEWEDVDKIIKVEEG
jgi:hypothetical protein